ncbi:MAG: GDP-mannose 4,6-dehydratase [Candidatus Binataceae bacterium]
MRHWQLIHALISALNEIETVFHLGAQTIVGTAVRDPLVTFESNVRGAYNLFEACRTHAGLIRRVILASTDKVYGDSPVLPYVEEMPFSNTFLQRRPGGCSVGAPATIWKPGCARQSLGTERFWKPKSHPRPRLVNPRNPEARRSWRIEMVI